MSEEVEQMTDSAKRPKQTDVSGFVDRIIRPLTRIFNPLVKRVAGGRWVPMWSLLHHRGHRSGRTYTTPITAMPRGDFFWISLAFGQDSGWARNILAAGECVLRYRGTDYHLVEPVVVDASSVRSQLPLMFRVGLPAMGLHKVLRMRAITQA